MLSLRFVSRRSKNFTSNVAVRMPTPVSVDHYLRSRKPTNGWGRPRRHCVTPSGDRRMLESDSGRRGRECGAPTGNPRTEEPQGLLRALGECRGRDRGPVPLFHATIFRAVRRAARERTTRHYRACFEHSNLFKVNVPARPRHDADESGRDADNILSVVAFPSRHTHAAYNGAKKATPKRETNDARGELTWRAITARAHLPAGRLADTPGTITWGSTRGVPAQWSNAAKTQIRLRAF